MPAKYRFFIDFVVFLSLRIKNWIWKVKSLDVIFVLLIVRGQELIFLQKVVIFGGYCIVNFELAFIFFAVVGVRSSLSDS